MSCTRPLKPHHPVYSEMLLKSAAEGSIVGMEPRLR